MAERRMFAKTIIDSDAFLEMPATTQMLYFHLSMRADDDGFINNPKRIIRMTGASEDDMKILLSKSFVIAFETGVVVIKHWRINNYLRNDRYKPTVYEDEMSQLNVKENGAYTLGIPNGYQMETQYSIGNDSIGKNSIEERETRRKYGLYKNVLLSDSDYAKLVEEFPLDYDDRIARLSEYIASTGKRYKNHLATIRAWARKDAAKDKKTEDALAQWLASKEFDDDQG